MCEESNGAAALTEQDHGHTIIVFDLFPALLLEQINDLLATLGKNLEM